MQPDNSKHKPTPESPESKRPPACKPPSSNAKPAAHAAGFFISRFGGCRFRRARTPKQQPNHEQQFDEREVKQCTERNVWKCVRSKSVRDPVNAVHDKQHAQ